MLDTFRRFSLVLALGVAALAARSVRAAPPPASPERVTSIVLVHGAWADGSSWDEIVPLLEARGYRVVAVHEPLTSLPDDAAAVQRAIDRMPGKVLLVGHSYGGAVITQAGVNPKVVGLVYVDGFAPDAGESIDDLGKGQRPLPWTKALRIDSGGYAWLPVRTVITQFAQDLPPARARLLAAKQGPLPVDALKQKVSVAAWHTRPSWYVRGTNDRIISPAAQQAMARRISARIVSIPSSHVPMLSQPAVVARVILEAAARAPHGLPRGAVEARRER